MSWFPNFQIFPLLFACATTSVTAPSLLNMALLFSQTTTDICHLVWEKDKENKDPPDQPESNRKVRDEADEWNLVSSGTL